MHFDNSSDANVTCKPQLWKTLSLTLLHMCTAYEEKEEEEKEKEEDEEKENEEEQEEEEEEEIS